MNLTGNDLYFSFDKPPKHAIISTTESGSVFAGLLNLGARNILIRLLTSPLYKRKIEIFSNPIGGVDPPQQFTMLSRFG